MKNVITLNMDTVNSVLDFSNFLKKFFNARVRVMPENEKDDGIIFMADFNAMYFIQYSCFQWVNITVYASGAICVEPVYDFVDIYFLNKKEDPAFKLIFNGISSFFGWIKEGQLSAIEFPSIKIEDFEYIDLEKREKCLKEWENAFERLVPYGVVVTDQRKEKIAKSPFIFELCVPGEPGEYDCCCENPYEGTRGQDYELFYPGEKDWNKKLKRIIKHLKKIYKLEELEVSLLPLKETTSDSNDGV